MRHLLRLMIVCSFVLQGCATEYKGRDPDFKLSGAAARTEIENFSLDDNYWHQGVFLRMGPEGTAYTLPSLEPLVAKVSSEAAARVQTAKTLRKIQLLTSLATLGMLVAANLTEDDSTKIALYTGVLVGAGSTITLGFVFPGYLASAAKDYNRDLRARFSPALGLNYSF